MSQCIMDDGHMGNPPQNRMTGAYENITYITFRNSFAGGKTSILTKISTFYKKIYILGTNTYIDATRNLQGMEKQLRFLMPHTPLSTIA